MYSDVIRHRDDVGNGFVVSCIQNVREMTVSSQTAGFDFFARLVAHFGCHPCIATENNNSAEQHAPQGVPWAANSVRQYSLG